MEPCTIEEAFAKLELLKVFKLSYNPRRGYLALL